MRVVSFNIRCSNDSDGHSVDERAPRLRAVLEAADADIIGFQETRPWWLEHIERDYGETYGIYNKYRDLAKPEACTVLWKKDKFELIDTGCLWYSDTPWVMSRGWDEVYSCPRQAVWTLLREKESGKEVAFFCTHFGFGDTCQTQSAALLAKTVETVGFPNSIIVGDFNLKPTDPAYATLTKHFKDANALLERDTRGTFHAYGKQDRTIDFVFVTDEGAKPVGYRLLDDTFDGKYPSDHYGLQFDMELK